MRANLLALLLASSALAACGVDATPQSGGTAPEVNSEPAKSQSAPAEQPAADAEKAAAPTSEPEANEDGEKKSE